MITKKIKYVNFLDEEVEETAMFHLGARDLVRLETSYDQGLEKAITDMAEAEDGRGVMEFFDRVVSLAYGKRSTDGRSFVKDEEDTKLFMQSPAYDEFFLELLSDVEIAQAFFNALVPNALLERARVNESDKGDDVTRR